MRIAEGSPLILGSASPRRREILESVRVPFVVVAADVDETVLALESPDTYLERIVLAKLVAVRALLAAPLASRAAAVLVADTSVIVDASILGKPGSVTEGLAMIERLSGRTHEVHTRFVIATPHRADHGSDAPHHAETVVTRVTFRPLSPAEARAYAESGEGRDKAGGYAVQGLGAALVSRIDGSYTNVVGLPACEVVVALQRLGLT